MRDRITTVVILSRSYSITLHRLLLDHFRLSVRDKSEHCENSDS